MDQDTEGNEPDASASIAIKRKRGRPRKYPRPNFNHRVNAVTMEHNFNRRHNAHNPPGFEGVNGNYSHQVDPTNDTNDVMEGQMVYGVIEATFDAGYLLTVRVGNAETTLRGVVFKPGHYMPVSAENDVAPNLQMIRRNEIPFPAENYTHAHGYDPQLRERNGQHVNSLKNGTANLAASKSKQTAAMVAQTAQPVISKNNVVPVVLQPANLSNGGAVASHPSPVAIEAAHPEVSKDKQVLETAHILNGSTSTNQAQTVGNQALPLHTQTNHQGVVNQPPAEIPHEAEAKFKKLLGMPFEKLLTEVVKRIQAPPQSAETENGNGEDDAGNMDRALSSEPLQAVQPDPHSHSVSVSKSFENFKTGKMTELLRAVQENMIENQVPQADEPTADSRVTVDNQDSPKAEIGNK